MKATKAASIVSVFPVPVGMMIVAGLVRLRPVSADRVDPAELRRTADRGG